MGHPLQMFTSSTAGTQPDSSCTLAAAGPMSASPAPRPEPLSIMLKAIAWSGGDGHFIRIVRETVYLVHQTAREFLICKTHGAPQPEVDIPIPSPPEGSWHKSIVLKKAHNEVLNICLHYLSLLNAKDSRRLPIAESLLSDQFACRYWAVHYRCVAPDLTLSQLDACARLCNSQSLGFGEWFNRAYELAQNPGHGLREGVTQRDIAHEFGQDEVVQLLDRMLKPEDVQEALASQQGVAPAAHGEDGSIAVPNSPRLLALEDAVHPHTISPGHLLESPLSEAVHTGFHLVGANHRRLSDWEDHSTRRYP